MPVPAFRITSRKPDPNLTEMVSAAEVSDPVSAPEGENGMKLPDDPEKLHWIPAVFSEFYLAHPQRRSFPTQGEKVYCYRFRVRVQETMDLKVLVGSDGTFVFFWNRHELMRHRTDNPMVPDEFSCRVTAEAGVHECFIVQSSNHGNAWGICCRFRRPGGGTLPEIVPAGEK